LTVVVALASLLLPQLLRVEVEVVEVGLATPAESCRRHPGSSLMRG
jgi:hypothetical protein